MKKEVLLAKVKEQAIALRNALTEEQKAKINYATFNPQLSTSCLLAQIFGRFDAPKAIEILPKSIFSRIRDLDIFEGWSFEKNNKVRIDFNRFDLTTEKDETVVNGNKFNHLTHLEVYLMAETNSEDLFKYLKGEVETFEPSFLEVAVEV